MNTSSKFPSLAPKSFQMTEVNGHKTENYSSNLNYRLKTQNQIELRKLRMYHDKMDKMRNRLIKDSNRNIKFIERKKLHPLREKKRCLVTKQNIRQEEMKREAQSRTKISQVEIFKYNPPEPYGRWVRLPEYHKEKKLKC